MNTNPNGKGRPRFEHVEDYDYPNEHGELLLQKRRWKTNDKRGKSFSYRSRSRADWPWSYKYNSKGVFYSKDFCPNADDLLYRLPELLQAIKDSVKPIFWTEGEKDADALVRKFGVVATTHHQGADHSTDAQAQWFERYGGTIVLCVDWDLPGCACGLRRYRQLRAYGIPDDRIAIVRARTTGLRPSEIGGQDISDHIENGGTLSDLAAVPVRVLERYAAQYTPAIARDADYR